MSTLPAFCCTVGPHAIISSTRCIISTIIRVWIYPSICLDKPLGLQEVEPPRISRQSALEGSKVVSPTHRAPIPPTGIRGTLFCWGLSRPQCLSAAGKIKSIKNPNIPTGIESAISGLYRSVGHWCIIVKLLTDHRPLPEFYNKFTIEPDTWNSSLEKMVVVHVVRKCASSYVNPGFMSVQITASIWSLFSAIWTLSNPVHRNPS